MAPIIEKRLKELSSKSRTVFISYSHDSPEHKAWVGNLARELRQANFDVVRDEDEIDLELYESPSERIQIISEMMSLFSYCKNILFINTPTFCRSIQAGEKRIPHTDFVAFTDYDSRFVFIEHQVILSALKKRDFRIISLLREGHRYVYRAEDRVFPMIDFRDDRLFSESFEYLIHYLEEGSAEQAGASKSSSIVGTVECTECDLTYPYSSLPPKVCNNCGEIYENERWLCPRCGYNKFAPFFIDGMEDVTFVCPHCGRGKLSLRKKP